MSDDDGSEIDRSALEAVWSKYIVGPDFLQCTSAVAKQAKLDRDLLVKYKKLLKDTRQVSEHVP
eukprot:7919524-Pyramimonas_sp.AAC.1